MIMTSNEAPKARFTYRIPEYRGRTLFDEVVERAVPEIFKFAEYATVAGFVIYLGAKTGNFLMGAFGYALLGCVYLFAMQKLLIFVKALRFRSIWTMRLSFILLLIGGSLFAFSSILMVLSIASAQAGTT